MDDDLDMLEFLQYIIGCTYISDLRFEPYNKRAKRILEKLDLTNYSLDQVTDVIEYIYEKKWLFN